MNKIKIILSVTASVLVLSLAAAGVFNMGLDKIFGNVAVLSMAAAAPEGARGTLSSLFFSESSEVISPSEPQTNTVEQAAAPITGKVDVSAVTEQKMGNIIKKTLSPYNANTQWNNVNINKKFSESIDIAADLSGKLGFKVVKSDEPQILIYHTHTTEAFMNDESEYYTNRDEPRSTDAEQNIVKIGDIIAEKLEEAGYKVVHDKTIHDHPAFSGSYNRSAETVKNALEKYPSIKIAIDVHRDSISSGTSDKIAPVMTVDGREAAQVMLVMGSQTGSVSDYPNWRENLRLATKLQYVFESNYPQFARPMLLKSARYNQNLTTGSILLEVGSDANTFEQAKYSAELVGESLVLLLNSQ